MADEKINSTANNIQIDIDNLSYVDYLWTQRTSDTAIQGIRLDQRNLPLNLNADTVDNKHASDFASASHTHNYAGSDSAGGAANSVKGALTFGAKTYNGSTSQEITLSDLGGNIINCYDTSTSDKAGTWTVSIPNITELTEGLTIKIRLKTSYNGTINTLNVNGLGAKTIYFRYGNKLTSHYGKESILALTYTSNAISSGTDRSGWIVENIYDSTNTFQLRKYYSRYTTKSALYRYMICFVNRDNLLVPANNVNNSTATNKTLTTDSFDLSKGIYYYNSTTTVEAGKLTGNAILYQQIGLLDLRYSFNTGTTLVAHKPVYLVVTPYGGYGEVILATNPIAQELPTASDGNRYVFLGYAYDNYRIELTLDHPIYVYNSIKETYVSEDYSQDSNIKKNATDILNINNSISNLENNKVSKSGDTMTGDLNPKANKGASLGTSSLYWNNIYGKTIYEDGTSLVNKYAAQSHTHNYAASDTAGGPANSVKENLTIGGVIYNGSTAVNIPYGSDIMAISSTTSTPGTISQLSRADHIHKIDLATGDANGQVKIAGTNIDVKGLGSAAYTNSTDYATPDWTKEHWAKEINTQDVRIWGLDQGIYKLTYGMDSTTPKDHIVNIYYNGETGTEKKSISPTPLYLYVDAVNATAATRLTSWRLYVHSGTIFRGRTNSTSGTIEQGWAISYITKLNGATTANTIYAPTTSGTSGQILQSNGNSAAPTWIDVSDAKSIQFTDNKVLINDGGTLSGRLYLKITSGNANGSISNADKTALYDISCKGIGNPIVIYTPNGDTIEITTNAQTGVLYDTGIDLDVASGWYLNGLTDLEVYGDKIASLNLQESFDRVNQVATSAIANVTWANYPGTLTFKDSTGTTKSIITLPISQYNGTTYGECWTINAPNLEYSMQIGASGFTVDGEFPGAGQEYNILHVNDSTFTYNGHGVLHNGNATKMASFYSHSGSKYVDIRTNQGSSTTNGVVIIATGTINLAGETTISLTHSMPNTNYALFFTQVNSSTSATTTYVPIIRTKGTSNFKVFIGSGGVTYNYLAVFVG